MWKAVASLLIFAAGAAAAFATMHLYETGSDEGAPATSQAPAPQTYTLADGDVALRPAARVRCVASHEGGQPNLFCTRVPRGRHQVIFYADSVLVWPLARGPDGPPFSYRWQP